MNEPKYIIESNVHIFLENFVDAIKDGWRVNNTNHGWVSEANGLKEITLFYDPEREYDTVELGEFVVSDYSTQTFLHKLCECISQGGNLNMDTLWWDLSGLKSIKGTIYKIPEYTKEQLNDLTWEDFKEAVKPVVGTGRDRNLLLGRYLAATGQSV
jgi:hypothetical protein